MPCERASLRTSEVINLFFNWRILLYRILLFSVKYQHESAIGVHMSPPSWTFLPSPSASHPSSWYRAPVWVPWDNNKFPLAINFTYGNVSFYSTKHTISHQTLTFTDSDWVCEGVLFIFTLLHSFSQTQQWWETNSPVLRTSTVETGPRLYCLLTKLP